MIKTIKIINYVTRILLVAAICALIIGGILTAQNPAAKADNEKVTVQLTAFDIEPGEDYYITTFQFRITNKSEHKLKKVGYKLDIAYRQAYSGALQSIGTLDFSSEPSSGIPSGETATVTKTVKLNSTYNTTKRQSMGDMLYAAQKEFLRYTITVTNAKYTF